MQSLPSFIPGPGRGLGEAVPQQSRYVRRLSCPKGNPEGTDIPYQNELLPLKHAPLSPRAAWPPEGREGEASAGPARRAVGSAARGRPTGRRPGENKNPGVSSGRHERKLNAEKLF